MGAPLPSSIKRSISPEEDLILGECHSRLNKMLVREYAKLGIPSEDRGPEALCARASLMLDFDFLPMELPLVIEALETAERALMKDRRALVYCGGNQFKMTPDDFQAIAQKLHTNMSR